MYNHMFHVSQYHAIHLQNIPSFYLNYQNCFLDIGVQQEAGLRTKSHNVVGDVIGDVICDVIWDVHGGMC